MGVADTFAEAFVKSQLAAGVRLPSGGKVFISVRNSDKPKVVEIARTLAALGCTLLATRGTAAALAEADQIRRAGTSIAGEQVVLDFAAYAAATRPLHGHRPEAGGEQR